MTWETKENEHIKNALDSFLRSGVNSRSLVFLGDAGSSKEQMAKEFAYKLIGNRSGLIEISGETLNLEGAREVIGWLALKSTSEDMQFLLVKNADQLSLEIFNAFLKTIEEPKSNTVICFLADRQNLPNTVFSRCMVFRFSGEKLQTQNMPLRSFLNMDSVSRVKFLLEQAELEGEALRLLLESWIKNLVGELGAFEPSKLHSVGSNLLEAWQRLQQNANKKMTAQFIARSL